MSDYRGCLIIQCFLVQSNMVTVPHNMVRLERMLDYRGVRLQRFHCIVQKDTIFIEIYSPVQSAKSYTSHIIYLAVGLRKFHTVPGPTHICLALCLSSPMFA